MVTVHKIDTSSKAQVRRFINLPYKFYRQDPVWVPPLQIDMEDQLNRQKFPFFEHSDADFFIAVMDGQDVGRIAVLENRRYNQHQGNHEANFYFFESIDDQNVADALFERSFDWAHERGLDTVVGPRGMSPVDGYGMLVDGFDLPQMMVMMPHNPPYYVSLTEAVGFKKKVHYLSCFASPQYFQFPQQIHRIAERVQKRGTFRVQRFRSTSELKTWSKKIGQAYNQSFVHNWEYYPLTEREIAAIEKTLLSFADPDLVKIIVHGEEVVGFLFAFPDIAKAIQRSQGRLFPFGLLDMLIEIRRTKWVSINIVGILPEYQGCGGNALLYSEIEKTIRQRNFENAALYQVAETAVNMRSDLAKVEGMAYKNHWVYTRKI